MDLDGCGGLIMREIIATFGEGEHAFALKFDQIVEIETTSKGALVDLKDRWSRDRLTARETRDVIRLGLIGAGETPAAALRTVAKGFDEQSLNDNMLLAGRVLWVGLYGRCLLDDMKKMADAAAGALAGEPEPAASSSGATASTSPE